MKLSEVSESVKESRTVTVKLIQVGMGGWGRSWARDVVPTVPEIEPVAYVEIDGEARADAQSSLGAPPGRLFSTLRDALLAVEADAVLVTTPVGGHVPVGLEAVAAGKHVMVEKPLASNTVEGSRLVDAAAAQGVVAMVSQNYRFFPAPRKAAELIHNRTLGRPHFVAIEFRRNLAPNNTNHHKLKSPLLVDMAIHHFDLLRVILQDEPTELYCRTWNPADSPYEDMPSAAAVIRFAGGTMVAYQGSWVSTGKPTYWAGEWRMECDEGQISWTSRAGGATGTRRDRLSVKPTGKRARRIPLPEPSRSGRAASLQAFAQAVATGEPPAIASTAADNLGSIAFMEAMLESARTGQPVHLISSRPGIGAKA
jgi:predicted dehydrogenase